MKITLNRLSLINIFELSNFIQERCLSLQNMEDVAQELMNILCNSFVTDSGKSLFVLGRFFKSCPYSELPGDIQRYICSKENNRTILPGNKYLTLLGTWGDLEEWKSRKKSKNHKAIPLDDPGIVARLPMLSALFSQIGFQLPQMLLPDKSIIVKGQYKKFGLFSVEDAKGSKFVPRQTDFVEPFAVKSSFGFGGTYSSGNMYTIILFTRETYYRKDASVFLNLNPTIKRITLGHEITGRIFHAKTILPFVNEHINRVTASTNRSCEETINQEHAVALEKEKTETLADELEVKNESLIEIAKDLEKSNEVLQNEIARHKRTMKTLKESREKVQLLLNSTGEAICGLDKDGIFTFANLECIRMLGYEEEDQMLGKNMHDLIHHSRNDGTPCPVEECKIYRAFREGKGATANDEVFWRSDGTCFPVEYTSSPIQRNNTVIGSVVTFVDITERKRAEEELKRIFELSVDMICIADIAHGYFIKINPAFEKTLGYSREEILGKPLLYFVHPEDKICTQNMIEKKLSSGEVVINFENRYVCKNGSYRWLMWNAFPIREEKIVYAVARDITEKKLVEEELKIYRNQLEELVTERTAALRKANDYLQMEIIERKRVKDQLQSILDNTTAVIYLKDVRGKFILINRQFEKLFHITKKEIIGKTDKDIFPEEMANAFLSNDQKVRETKAPLEIEEIAPHDDGPHTYISIKFPLFDSDGNLYGICGISTDITERKKAEERMQMAAKVFETAIEGVTVTDSEGTIIFINPAFSAITGYSKKEVIGKNYRILKSDKHDDGFYKNIWNSLIREGKWQGEVWNRRKNGETYPEWLNITAVQNSNGKRTQYVSVSHDITELKKNQEKIEYQAYHDALTGLPNRHLLYDRLSMSIKHVHRTKAKLAVLFVDLDGFKNINDTLGHAVGDLLLQEVTRRLLKCCREEDTVARVGGDEFVICLSDIDNLYDATEAAERVIREVKVPFLIDNNECYIGACVGIAMYPADGENAEVLIKNADMAMYRAKNSGKNTYQLFTSAMNRDAMKRFQMESRLRKAWDRKEFSVYYQPKISSRTGLVVGVEALVRWQDINGSFISPAEFLPVAEKIGLIINIDEWVFYEACKFMKKLHGMGFDAMKLSVNLSARNFEQSTFIGRIRKTIEDIGLLPQYVELEVTESMLIENINFAVAILNKMRNLGLGVAIDDFGKGYSSLNYLKKFPITTLKIDKSFIDGIPKDQKSKSIAQAMISMSHDMGIKVLAEGVESKEQLDYLKGIDCDEIQGYVFSAPVPQEKILQLLCKERADSINMIR
ncbi:MAG: PAS domain S-box protein [Candidatus Brocadiaceae bacterium]|nr:PAS domain S-box protein [Candidatus Brocadiaceae bacterium]